MTLIPLGSSSSYNTLNTFRISVLDQRKTSTSSTSSIAKKLESKGKEIQIKDGDSSNKESIPSTNRRNYSIKVNKSDNYYRDRNSLDN